MTQREPAIAKLQIDNERVRVTEYRFAPNAETTFHRHEFDYLVVPQTNGNLLLIDANGEETQAQLTQGISYYREAGVEHNVINAGKKELVFIEIEMIRTDFGASRVPPRTPVCTQERPKGASERFLWAHGSPNWSWKSSVGEC